MQGTQFTGLPTTFFDASALKDFWGYVIWYAKYNMPFLMIVLAIFVAYMVSMTVIQMVVEAKNGTADSRRRTDKDDDDIEVRHY